MLLKSDPVVLYLRAAIIGRRATAKPRFGLKRSRKFQIKIRHEFWRMTEDLKVSLMRAGNAINAQARDRGLIEKNQSVYCLRDSTSRQNS